MCLFSSGHGDTAVRQTRSPALLGLTFQWEMDNKQDTEVKNIVTQMINTKQKKNEDKKEDKQYQESLKFQRGDQERPPPVAGFV